MPLTLARPMRTNPGPAPEELLGSNPDKLRPARGVMWGVALSVCAWIAVGGVVWWLT